MLSHKISCLNAKVEQNAEIQFLFQEKIHARALPFQQHCAEAIAVRFTDVRPLRASSMLGIEYSRTLERQRLYFTASVASLLDGQCRLSDISARFPVSPASFAPASCISPSAAVLTFEPSDIR